MKKLLLILLLVVSCSFAQTGPSWLQLKDGPVFDIRNYALEADPFAACYAAANATRGSVIYLGTDNYTTAGPFTAPKYLTITGGGTPTSSTSAITFSNGLGFIVEPGEGLTINNVNLFGIGTSTVSIVATATTALSASVRTAVYASTDAQVSGGSVRIINTRISGFDVGVYARGNLNYQRYERTVVDRCRFGVLFQGNGEPSIWSPNGTNFTSCVMNLNSHSACWIGAGVGDVKIEGDVEVTGATALGEGLTVECKGYGVGDGINIGKYSSTASWTVALDAGSNIKFLSGELEPFTIGYQEMAVKGSLIMTPRASPWANTKGGIYFDSDDNHFYGYNGTTWVQLDN